MSNEMNGSYVRMIKILKEARYDRKPKPQSRPHNPNAGLMKGGGSITTYKHVDGKLVKTYDSDTATPEERAAFNKKRAAEYAKRRKKAGTKKVKGTHRTRTVDIDDESPQGLAKTARVVKGLTKPSKKKASKKKASKKNVVEMSTAQRRLQYGSSARVARETTPGGRERLVTLRQGSRPGTQQARTDSQAFQKQIRQSGGAQTHVSHTSPPQGPPLHEVYGRMTEALARRAVRGAVGTAALATCLAGGSCAGVPQKPVSPTTGVAQPGQPSRGGASLARSQHSSPMAHMNALLQKQGEEPLPATKSNRNILTTPLKGIGSSHPEPSLRGGKPQTFDPLTTDPDEFLKNPKLQKQFGPSTSPRGEAMLRAADKMNLDLDALRSGTRKAAAGARAAADKAIRRASSPSPADVLKRSGIRRRR